MLTGKMTAKTTFAADDHRNFNRYGQAFDRGETFSGVDYDTGLQAVAEVQSLVPVGSTLAQTALRWILMYDAVSTIIPGAKTLQQVEDNCAASDLPAFGNKQMAQVQAVYDSLIREQVHQRW